MKVSVIIVAGGSGSRMTTATPKQFLTIGGVPILIHTINRFLEYNNDIQIILVLPEKHIESWKKLCNVHNFNQDYEIALGGKTRFESVKNGLKKVNNEFVGVHDGVRPFVSIKSIEKAYQSAFLHKTAVPCIELKDSIRKINSDSTIAEDRTKYRLVQTPQVFETKLLKKAYLQDYSDLFTDDASVVESLGVEINLTEGNTENIKITTLEDLVIAEAILKRIK